MRAAEVAFVGALVHRFPVLEPLLQEHLDDFDELLPHLFMGDVTRWAVKQVQSPASPPELRAVLDFLESSFQGEFVEELISVSFLESLPRPGEPGSELRQQVGPRLTRQLRVIG